MVKKKNNKILLSLGRILKAFLIKLALTKVGIRVNLTKIKIVLEIKNLIKIRIIKVILKRNNLIYNLEYFIRENLKNYYTTS